MPSPKRHRNFRIENLWWFAASRIATIKGQRISDVMRDLTRNYVQRHKRLLADDPEWQRWLRDNHYDASWNYLGGPTDDTSDDA